MRRITKLVAVAGVLLAILASARAEKVNFGTDWKAEAEHGGFYQAIATGIYKKHDLEVTLRPGGPQLNHAQLLAAGRLDFDIGSNSFAPLNFLKEKIPMVAVAAIFQKDPSVLIAHPGQGNDNLAALKGKPIMISADARIGAWLFLKQKFGYTDDQIRPYAFSAAPFLADPKAIQQGYLTSEPFTIEKQGEHPVVMLLADAGYASYGSIIQTSAKLMQEKPDLVQRFIDASIEGWYSYLYVDPSPANALIKSDNAEMTDDLIAYGISKIKEQGIIDSGDAKTNGIGAMSDTRWNEFFETMVKAGLYPAEMDYRKAFTTQFVNKKVGMKNRNGSIGPQRRFVRVNQSAASPAPLSATILFDNGTATAPRNVIVSLEAVGKRFGSGVDALADIDLSVRQGEFLSLIDPSGCGKSTLLRIVAGLTAATSGKCRVAIGDPSGRRAAAGRIGFVFQDATLMPWGTVAANVMLPFRIARRLGPAERERAREAIRAVGLAGFEEAYPHQLSGGMRMRVSIARALVTEPDLLLLDEPFAALDEITRLALNDDLLRLWERYTPTVLFVTHSVYESVYLSTRIAVMSARPGRVVADFAIEFEQPRTQSVRTSPAYGALCEGVSAALAEAMTSRRGQ